VSVDIVYVIIISTVVVIVSFMLNCQSDDVLCSFCSLLMLSHRASLQTVYWQQNYSRTLMLQQSLIFLKKSIFVILF